MKKYCLCWLFSIFCFGANAQALLSEHAQISLLTTTPCDNEVYTLYGHTSIRVRDSVAADRKIDLVFNYGQFDASKPYFVYRFAKGELDYELSCYDYRFFAGDRELLNSDVYEQVLNFTAQEKQAIWAALILNIQPENRTYRYNFFFDNCATRPAQLIEQIVNGQIIYNEYTVKATFRDIINYCTRDNSWLTFGCDLVLGLPTDRVVTFRESFFIPEYLKDAFSDAQIVNPDGTNRSLVASEYLLVEKIDDTPPKKSFLTPFVCSLLLLAVVLYMTRKEWRTKKYFRGLDCLLFFAAGITGCILFFLCFLSVHPSIWPNISVLWLHPFHLLGVVLFAVKKLNKAAYSYHFINFVALLLMLLAWIFIRQHLNIAFIPLIAIFLLRSGYFIMREKITLR